LQLGQEIQDVAILSFDDWEGCRVTAEAFESNCLSILEFQNSQDYELKNSSLTVKLDSEEGTLQSIRTTNFEQGK
jgi:hypothetical protein